MRLSNSAIVRTQTSTNNNEQVQTKSIIMPYIEKISDLTARLLKPHGVMVARKPMETLRQIVSKPENMNKFEGKNNVVNHIQCNDCTAEYVDQTGQKLALRLHEHQLAMKRHDRLSLIPVHRYSKGHQFNSSTVEILD